MGCMNSREGYESSESPTDLVESAQPLIGGADQDNVIRGYDGGVAVVSSKLSSDQPSIQTDQLYLSDSEAIVGGVARVSGHPNQRAFNSLSSRGTLQVSARSHNEPKDTSKAFNGNGVVSRHISVAADGECSPRGNEVMANLKKAYDWHEIYDSPSQEFLSLMDRLYMECQVHLSNLSSKGDTDSRQEADLIVHEMISVRNRWGPNLLPNSICNAFVRERIPLMMERHQFRIDCAQFFEPVPFYGSRQADNPGELMKLYRFSVYNLLRNEIVVRYYLERSNVTQLYHVLCFTCNNYRGQVYPYGSECPTYWEVREHMIEDVQSRLQILISQGAHPHAPIHAATYFPPPSAASSGPVIIQIPS